MFEPRTAAELAQEYALELIGDASACVKSVASVEEATASDLSFIRGSKYGKYLEKTQAGVLIIPDDLKHDAELPTGRAYLKSKDAYASFARFLQDHLVPEPKLGVISPAAVIDPSAEVHPEVNIEAGVWVGPHAKIGRGTVIQAGVRLGEAVEVGENCLLCANVVIERRVQLGSRVTLNPGVVIGGDGFGYAQTEAGNLKLPQIGAVIIGDGVEVGANSTIDRGSLSPTVIGEGTVIDNLVQIGHGAVVGKHCVICSQSGIAGSAVVGDKTIMASRSGVGDHLKIAAGSTIGPMAGVAKDIEEPGVYSGFPTMDHREWLKMVSVMAQLPALRSYFKGVMQQQNGEAKA